MARVAAAVTALAFAVVGCGDEQSSTPLTQAADATEAAGTADVVSTSQGNAGGLSYSHRRVGVVDYAGGFSSLTQHSKIAGESREATRQVEFDGAYYTLLPQPGTKRWIRESGPETVGPSDPFRLLGYVREATNVVRTGTARFRGASVTRYRGRLDLRRAIERDLEERGWSRGSIDEFLGMSPVGDAVVEVLVGEDGRIRQIDIDSKADGHHETLELSGFGRKVTAAAPDGA
jgi:hypothetical protein